MPPPGTRPSTTARRNVSAEQTEPINAAAEVQIDPLVESLRRQRNLAIERARSLFDRSADAEPFVSIDNEAAVMSSLYSARLLDDYIALVQRVTTTSPTAERKS